MLKLLKRVMSGKGSKKEEIPFSHVHVWFESKIKDQNLTKQLSDFFNGLSHTLIVLSEQLINISKKDFSSDESGDVAKEHIATYASAIRTFLKQIDLPEKKDAESIVLYEETLSAAISNISNNVQNLIAAYKRFDSEDADAFSEAFDALIEAKEELHELVKKEHGVFYVYSIQKQIKEIQKKKKLVEELESNIQREEIKQKETEDYKVKLETELDNLKTSPEFEKYDIVLSRKLKTDREMERENQNMTLLFSNVSKLFADYAEKGLGADSALARQYAQNPLVTLHSDSQLFIIDLLKHVSEKLHKLEPDEKRRLRARQSLLNITEDVLRSHRSQYDQLKQLQSEVQRQLMMNSTTLKIEDMKYKLAHVDEQIKLFKENKNKHDDAIAKINIDKDIQLLQRNLQSLGGIVII